MIEEILAGLRATSPLEAVSVVFGFAYSVLAVKRSRWCWVAGFISSAILIYLSWGAKLPMQACLQAYYVAMAVYGFWRWSRDDGEGTRAVTTWPLKSHLIGWVVIVLVSVVSSRLLADQTQAAWPFLDSLTTWGSLLATWLVTQLKLENWLYWIAMDCISVFLFASQGLMFVALLFAVYLVVSSVGFVTWFKTWRASAQPG
ncbi:MAG: nicotinamide riboside transporter PnuC [Gammaproteobacteria bacterium]